ncbi:MAG: cytochrome P450 [Planctomycetes bacterium]|nr:cytochrome P450 [Planctomycetota bacterium]
MLRDPYAFHARCVERYGDPYTVRSFNGPVVCTGKPENIRAIFAADPACFGPWASRALLPMLGQGSVIQLRGEEHRRERALLGPHFGGARMRAFTEAMHSAARAQLHRLEPGREFRAAELAQAISLEVIIRAVMGCQEPREIDALRAGIQRFVGCANPLMLFAPALQRAPFGLGPWARFLAARRAFDEQLLAHIARRRAELERGAEPSDILGAMLASRYEDGSPMQDGHVRDELVTLLFAGHETTALAIAWALYWIHREPGVRERVRAQLAAAPDDPSHAGYLEAACQESLRLHPIVPDAPRYVARELELFGVRLPVGAGVTWVSSLAHMDPVLFSEPERFRPERFRERSFKPWEFLPFGGGARRCLGSAFALHEMREVLALLLQECDLELLDDRPLRARRRSVTMGPEGGVRMRLASRRAG